MRRDKAQPRRLALRRDGIAKAGALDSVQRRAHGSPVRAGSWGKFRSSESSYPAGAALDAAKRARVAPSIRSGAAPIMAAVLDRQRSFHLARHSAASSGVRQILKRLETIMPTRWSS